MCALATLAKYAQQTAHTHFARITRPFISGAAAAPFKFLHYSEIKEETRMEERTSQSKAHSVPDRDRRQGHSQRTYSNFSVIDYNLDCSAMYIPTTSFLWHILGQPLCEDII